MNRKAPRFFVINPVCDRRGEKRFESQEPIRVTHLPSGQTFSGLASEIGHFGLRMGGPFEFGIGDHVQLDFIRHPGNVGCFGRVVWCESGPNEGVSSVGLSVESWHGIVEGPKSWKRLKGAQVKKDRRRKTR